MSGTIEREVARVSKAGYQPQKTRTAWGVEFTKVFSTRGTWKSADGYLAETWEGDGGGWILRSPTAEADSFHGSLKGCAREIVRRRAGAGKEG